MSDANYVVAGSLQSDNTNSYAQNITVQTSTGSAKTASAFAIRCTSSGNAGTATNDYPNEMVAVFR
jgi:hypothetical protein